MRFIPTEKVMFSSTTPRFRPGLGMLLRQWLDNWWERRFQVRGNAMKAQLNDHLLRDIGHDDFPPTNGRISERRKAGIHAFNMQLLRTH